MTRVYTHSSHLSLVVPGQKMPPRPCDVHPHPPSNTPQSPGVLILRSVHIGGVNERGDVVDLLSERKKNLNDGIRLTRFKEKKIPFRSEVSAEL